MQDLLLFYHINLTMNCEVVYGLASGICEQALSQLALLPSQVTNIQIKTTRYSEINLFSLKPYKSSLNLSKHN